MKTSVPLLVLAFLAVVYAVPVQQSSGNENLRYGRHVPFGGLLGGLASALTPGFGGYGGYGNPYGGYGGYGNSFGYPGYGQGFGAYDQQPDITIINT
ncbi:neuropeptide-like protein 31 [Artemia franciscana]|uniref:neuropeptide-like protein 31 n=1 Tax=Artemia franciscana TaxID=6661 RepID=UPI0032DAD3E7